jgi:hypothetical protein
MFNITEMGRGAVHQDGDSFRLTVPPVTKDGYHNAQISTYTQKMDFVHEAPARLTIRAYGEGEIRGTAGYGFWNHPYEPGSWRLRLPKACWFFYGSPPNNMALAKGVPGFGWKAATFDAANWRFLTLLPTAPVGFLLMRLSALYNALWPIGQRALGVSERLLEADLLKKPHDYGLEWRKDGVTFSIDGQTVHETELSPGGRLGFVAWMDNQYAVVTPQGRFGFGTVDVPEMQALHIDWLRIE